MQDKTVLDFSTLLHISFINKLSLFEFSISFESCTFDNKFVYKLYVDDSLEYFDISNKLSRHYIIFS